MYHPYFRGKQFELITIRENAKLLKSAGFTPIIEPVQESLSGLKRTLDAVDAVSGNAVLIVNPFYGNHSDGSKEIEDLFQNELKQREGIAVGILLKESIDVTTAMRLFTSHKGRRICFVHAGFTAGRELANQLQQFGETAQHVFVAEHCGKLYRRHFAGAHRVLLDDGFHKRINREHPDLEGFSDLHVTFREEGMDGFGDFLVVGDDFADSGGPAYAVAIHLTFIDPDKDDQMFIRHFKSDRIDTPTDPAGKFAEALTKLVAEINRPGSHVQRTAAVIEFLDLHERRHFPGLGYVKKLSMSHHIETLATYLKDR